MHSEHGRLGARALDCRIGTRDVRTVRLRGVMVESLSRQRFNVTAPGGHRCPRSPRKLTGTGEDPSWSRGQSIVPEQSRRAETFKFPTRHAKSLLRDGPKHRFKIVFLFNVEKALKRVEVLF